MKARELLESAQLHAAITDVTEDLKLHPTDYRLRTFLFELLGFAGQWDRAERQLDALRSHEEHANLGGAEIYRTIVRAERTRRLVFSDGAVPKFLADPPAYVDLHLRAITAIRSGQFKEAKSLLDDASAVRPPIKGHLKGKAFEALCDSDDVLAPILEVITHGDYVWVPFEHIAKISLSAPRFLRDLLWVPAQLELVNGSSGQIFLPVVYVGSELEANDRLRLGRLTEWRDNGEGIVRGVGQRTLVIDGQDYGLLEIPEQEIALA